MSSTLIDILAVGVEFSSNVHDIRPVPGRMVGHLEVIETKFHGLVTRSLSAVSEAPTREDLSFRCAVKGRFRYSDLKEAAPRTMGFVCG
jgi:hypothetical protein